MDNKEIKYGVIVKDFPTNGKEVWCANVEPGKLYTFDINIAYQKRETMERNHRWKYTVEEFDNSIVWINGYAYRVEK